MFFKCNLSLFLKSVLCLCGSHWAKWEELQHQLWSLPCSARGMAVRPHCNGGKNLTSTCVVFVLSTDYRSLLVKTAKPKTETKELLENKVSRWMNKVSGYLTTGVKWCNINCNFWRINVAYIKHLETVSLVLIQMAWQTWVIKSKQN